MELRLAALVAVGSAIGGLLRYAVTSLLFERSDFPLGVLVVNVTGCFLIGFLVFGGMAGGWLPLNARVFLGVGLLGGFTTMSAFTYDTLALVERDGFAAAALNVVLTVALCLVSTGLGRWLALQIWARPTL